MRGVLLTEFGHVRSGAAHGCDSEEDRALQENILQLLAHCDISVFNQNMYSEQNRPRWL